MLLFQSEEQTTGGMKPKNSKVVGSCLSAALKFTQAEALNQGLLSGGTGLSCTLMHPPSCRSTQFGRDISCSTCSANTHNDRRVSHKACSLDCVSYI